LSAGYSKQTREVLERRRLLRLVNDDLRSGRERKQLERELAGAARFVFWAQAGVYVAGCLTILGLLWVGLHG
jgi:hypothetical protein